MNQYCTLQIFQNNEWQDCAIVELIANQEQGWRASTRTSYLFEYAIEHMDLRDGHALSFQFPVNVQNNLENQLNKSSNESVAESQPTKSWSNGIGKFVFIQKLNSL